MFLTSEEKAALRRILKLLRIKKGGFFLSLILGVAGLGSAVALAATSAWLIARASQMPPVLYLAVAATAVRMFGVFRAFFRYLQRLASHKVALEGMDQLRLGIFDTLMDGPVERVAALKSGDLLTRTGADVDQVGDLVVKAILPSCVTAVVAAGTVAGFALVSPPAALVLAVCLLISGVLAPLMTARATRLGEVAEQESKRELTINVQQLLENAPEVQVDGRLPTALRQIDEDSANWSFARSLAARPAAVAAALDKFAMGAAVVAVFLVATGPASLGFIPAVMFAVLILTPLAAFEGTAELGAAAAQLVRSGAAAKRISDMLGPETRPVMGQPEEGQPENTHPIPPGTPNLTTEDLAVGWPSGPTLVRDISLELQPSRRVAIVGPSGIGKTTLLYTLAGMLQPKAGAADLNGVPLWGAQRSDVTDRVSLTTEDAHIFATTVYENLRAARADLEPEEAKALLAQVGLGEWLAALPHGLETHLGMGGKSISGGERRRLLLARALASPARLMLLDEPGEHLDGETAEAILRALLDGTQGERGILIVTHRLSELDQVDQVIILQKNGRDIAVAEVGSHTELLERSEYYRRAIGAES